MIVQALVVIVGFALLVVGADALVEGASRIAARVGLSERVIGLTVVAIGTCMPEIVVSVTSAAQGHADMAFGNVAGSCMANLLLILGLSAVVSPLPLSRRTTRFEIPASIAAVAALLVASNMGGRLDRTGGMALLALFVAFVAWTVACGMRSDAQGEPVADELPGDPDDGRDGHDGRVMGLRVSDSPVATALLVAGGIALLKLGADQVVGGATSIAGALGVSERVIGITVVALGTCLPELVTSVVAAARGNADLAIGNVLGSNVANVLLVMGVPALFSPIAFDPVYNLHFAAVMLGSLMLAGFAFVDRRHTMTRRDGVVFVVLYALYVAVGALS